MRRIQLRSFQESAGLLLAMLAVVGFSATLPTTRLAVSYLDPTFVGLGRSLLAASLAALSLWLLRAPLPRRHQLVPLVVVALGVIIGFPLLMTYAMQTLPAAHGAIIVALLPLFTAITGAVRGGQRPSLGFWLTALSGSMVVLLFSLLEGKVGLQWSDGILLIACLFAAVGYSEGGLLARQMGGWQVICWALLLAVPVLLVPVWVSFSHRIVEAPMDAWLAFLYTALVSQLFAFVLWYQGMAWAGVVRTSQLQLLQPFLTLLLAAWLLGEELSLWMVLVSLLVVALIAISRRMPIDSVIKSEE